MKETKKSSELSSSIVASNDDLLTEILFRLPIKPLFRFKSVSKHWLSLITDSRFSERKNIDLGSNISALFICRRFSFSLRREYDVVRLDGSEQDFVPHRTTVSSADDHNKPLKILQSCNGLMLCSSCDPRWPQLNERYTYSIWNPTTNQFKKLPDSTRRVFGTRNGGAPGIAAIYIAFDPRKSPHYKAICIYYSEKINFDYEMEIYSSETGEWQPTGDPFFRTVSVDNGVYWNGAVHWIAVWNEDGLYYNIDEERLRVMPMPPIPDGKNRRYTDGCLERRPRYFGESNDHLHLIELYFPRPTQFNVYEMREDYFEWFIKYRVDIEAVMNVFPGARGDNSFLILSFVRGRNDQESFLMLSLPGMAIRYNLGDKTFKKIAEFIPCRNHEKEPMFGWYRYHDKEPMFDWYDVFHYIESISVV